MIDLKYYRNLFNDLNQLSKKLGYTNTDLILFSQYDEFYHWLEKEHSHILYKDDSYYWLEDLKPNLKQFANQYINKTNYKSIGTITDIPFIQENIHEMLTELIPTSQIIEQTPLQDQAKELAKEVLKEVLNPTNKGKKLSQKEQIKQDIQTAITREDRAIIKKHNQK